jgi:hypothetical protein
MFWCRYSTMALMAKPSISIVRAMESRRLWGPQFDDLSYRPWKAYMRAFEGLPLDADQLALYRECTGRTEAPTQPFAESVLICGRRSGKSRALAIIAAFLSVCRDWRPYLAEGEVATVAVLAADRAQARTLLRYIRALLEAVPEFRAHMGPPHSQRITLLQ